MLCGETHISSRKTAPDGGFMFQNNTKLIASVSLPIIALALLYYFFVFIPDQQYERQLKCADAGAKYKKDLESNAHVIVTKYVYNPTLKTCLIRYDLFFGKSLLPGQGLSVIADVYTNTTLYSYIDGAGQSKEDFEQKERELFGTNTRSLIQ